MKKIMKDAKGLMGLTIMGGVGSQLISQSGGSPVGLGRITRAAPMMGTLAGSRMVLGSIKMLQQSTKKKN